MSRLVGMIIGMILGAILFAGCKSDTKANSKLTRAEKIAAIRKMGGESLIGPYKGEKLLYLEGPKVTDDDLVYLEGLTGLTFLSLNGTSVTDAGLKHLEGLTTLKTLSLDGTKVTDAGVANLRKKLPNLEGVSREAEAMSFEDFLKEQQEMD